LQAEWVFELQGLGYPALDTFLDADEYDAVLLFIQRAGQVSRGFNARDHLAAVARICRLVEGLPLAIDLAAAAAAQRSPEKVMADLERDMQALATTMRDVPARHRSLRAVVDRSWDLLTDSERSVLQRLSVFRGGFDLVAARQAAGATQPMLTALLQKSLVLRRAADRYDLHPTVRQYAAEKLEAAGEAAGTFDQALEYFLALTAEGEEPNFARVRLPVWIDRMVEEQDNLRALLEWCQAQDRVEAWLRLAAVAQGPGVHRQTQSRRHSARD
jgi:predicted ATPase